MAETGSGGRRALAVALAVAMIAIGACAARRTPGPAPDWLEPDAPKRDAGYFYGVGCAPPELTNYYFKKSTAEERARVDLAFNLHAYFFDELGQDEAQARAAIEAALPLRELDGSYQYEDGRLCVRTRLARELVGP